MRARRQARSAVEQGQTRQEIQVLQARRFPFGRRSFALHLPGGQEALWQWLELHHQWLCGAEIQRGQAGLRAVPKRTECLRSRRRRKRGKYRSSKASAIRKKALPIG